MMKKMNTTEDNDRRPHSGLESQQQDTRRRRFDDDFAGMFVAAAPAAAAATADDDNSVDSFDLNDFEFANDAAAMGIAAPPNDNSAAAAADAVGAVDDNSINGFDLNDFEFANDALAAMGIAAPPNDNSAAPAAAAAAVGAVDDNSINGFDLNDFEFGNDALAAMRLEAPPNDEDEAATTPLKLEESTNGSDDDTSDGNGDVVTYNQFQTKSFYKGDKETLPHLVESTDGSVIFAGVSVRKCLELLCISHRMTGSFKDLPSSGRKVELRCKSDAMGNPIHYVVIKPQTANFKEEMSFQGSTHTVEAGRVAFAACGDTLPLTFDRQNSYSQHLSDAHRTMATVKAKFGNGKNIVIAVLPFRNWIGLVSRRGTLPPANMGEFIFISSNNGKEMKCKVSHSKYESGDGIVGVTELGADILPRGQFVEINDSSIRSKWRPAKLMGESCKYRSSILSLYMFLPQLVEEHISGYLNDLEHSLDKEYVTFSGRAKYSNPPPVRRRNRSSLDFEMSLLQVSGARHFPFPIFESGTNQLTNAINKLGEYMVS